jgi:hypothetical protein
MHYMGDLNREAYSATNKNADPATRVGGMQLYSDTKLFNTMTAAELDKRVKKAGQSVAITSVHPGFVISELDGDGSPLSQAVMPHIRSLLAHNTPQGALTQLRVATDPALAQAGGRYFEDNCINELCEGLEPHPDAMNDEALLWLWSTSAEMTGLK